MSKERNKPRFGTDWIDQPDWVKHWCRGIAMSVPIYVFAETENFAVIWIIGHTAYINRGRNAYAPTEYRLVKKGNGYQDDYHLFKYKLEMKTALREGRLKRGDRASFDRVLKKAEEKYAAVTTDSNNQSQ